jgi:malonate-semialdehyde dehydrogenase (acetylating)/methylmalonate-semialdehyde dehydrogenase
MEVPPEAIYSTREDLLTSVRNFALSQGYVVTIRRCTANKNVVLGCDMGGVYYDRVRALEGAKRRKTSTRRIGCPFELYGSYSNGCWQLKVRNPMHTHEPSDLSAHPQARKFADNQRAEIGRLSSTGCETTNY